MKKELAIGVILATLGATIGYFVKGYEERPQPRVLIENVALKAIPKENVPDINISKELQELSKVSKWTDDLQDKITFKDLEKIVKEHKDTVATLEKLTGFLPRLIQFINFHENMKSGIREYDRFLANNSDPETLAYLAMNFRSVIRRQEVALSQMRQAYPQAFEELPNVSILKRSQDVRWKLPNIEDDNSESDKATILAIALIKEWFPSDLKEVLVIVQGDVSSQIVPNQNLLAGLNKLFEDARKLIASEHILVDALFTNNGQTTVTFDKYGVLKISGINKSYFLLSDKDKDRISVSPGEAKSISLRSEEPLTGEEFKQLVTLYDTKILRCSLTTRMINTARFQGEWISSPPSDFSRDTARLKEDFLKNAPPLVGE